MIWDASISLTKTYSFNFFFSLFSYSLVEIQICHSSDLKRIHDTNINCIESRMLLHIGHISYGNWNTIQDYVSNDYRCQVLYITYNWFGWIVLHSDENCTLKWTSFWEVDCNTFMATIKLNFFFYIFLNKKIYSIFRFA